MLIPFLYRSTKKSTGRGGERGRRGGRKKKWKRKRREGKN